MVNTNSDDLVDIDVKEHEIKNNTEINSENIELTFDNHGDELSQHNVRIPKNLVKDRATY